MSDDLLWWWLTLHTPQLNGVSLEYFNALPPPDTVVEMVASDFGIRALDVFAQEALTYMFTPAECELISEFNAGAANSFDINFRELRSCAFAVQRWSMDAPINRRPRHAHFRIDNTSAVAWQNKLASRNPQAQVIIRQLSWWETSYRLRFSASHIAGAENTRADAVSRIPTSPSFAGVFALLTSGCTCLRR
ncbi:hypothetical protein PC119_g5041 [Phytophthora cactorum]|nr:hypothetical protein PC119_g5041 [Phytophthora cactorum]